MLKQIEVYDVTVSLNDGSEMQCALLSKPDARTLTAVAVERKEMEISRVLALVKAIDVPALGDVGFDTAIQVADTIIGTISVATESAYVMPAKRGRKPKVSASADECACSPSCNDCTGAACEE